MKTQGLFFSKDKSKNLKCLLLQYMLGALRVKNVVPVRITIVDTESVCKGKANETAHCIYPLKTTKFLVYLKPLVLCTANFSSL